MDHQPGFLAHVEARRPHVTEISIPDALDALKSHPETLLIDVRDDAEWMAAHAEGARHMSRGTIERDIELAVPDKNTPMLLYCGGGFRSILASAALQEMGYTNVKSVIDGWRGWLERNAPVERPERAERVTGIGGIFLKSPDPDRMREWYRKHLGIANMQSWGAFFTWRELANPNIEGMTVWSSMGDSSDYMGDSGQRAMINYRVRDLDQVLAALKSEGVEVDKAPEDSDFGRFAWIRDVDGNRVELWQPPGETLP